MAIAFLADELPYRSFRDGYIDLRGLGVTQPFIVSGPSEQTHSPAEIRHRSDSFGHALVQLSTHDTVDILYHKIVAPVPSVQSFSHRIAAMVDAERRGQYESGNHEVILSRLYLTHHYVHATVNFVESLMMAGKLPALHNQYELARDYALKRFQAFQDAAAGALEFTPMSDQQIYDDLLLATSYQHIPLELPDPYVRLNEALAQSRQINGMEPFINGYYLAVVAVSAYPRGTRPHIISRLLAQPGEMLISARYRVFDGYDARLEIEKYKNHYNRVMNDGIFGMVRQCFGWKASGDEHSQQMKDDIARALADCANGVPFGIGTITAILRDQDKQRLMWRAHEMVRNCRIAGLGAMIEDWNAASAIVASWPGTQEQNLMGFLQSGYNFADAALPNTPYIGTPFVDSQNFQKGTPSPLIFGGDNQGAPFFYPFAIDGIMHQLVVGPTGSRKSSLAALTALYYHAIPNARIHWIDFGRSSYLFSRIMGARYHDIGAEHSRPLCPLSLLDKEGGLQYLMGWFQRIFALRRNFELDEEGSKVLQEALQSVRMRRNPVFSAECRNLRELKAKIPGGTEQTNRMRTIIEELISGYGHIFGGDEPLSSSQITIYEMENLKGAPTHITVAATTLILQSILFELNGDPTWIIADEFHNQLREREEAAFLEQSLRAFRRKNCGFVGYTQSVQELVNSPLAALMLESFPVKVFFPNYEAKNPIVSKALQTIGLLPHEAHRIASLGADQFLVRTRQGARIVTNKLGELARIVCASTGLHDIRAAEQLLREYPNGDFADAYIDFRRELCIPEPASAEALSGSGSVAISDS